MSKSRWEWSGSGDPRALAAELVAHYSEPPRGETTSALPVLAEIANMAWGADRDGWIGRAMAPRSAVRDATRAFRRTWGVDPNLVF